MGYAGKLDKKMKALELRKQGYSYGEILKNIAVSKDTLSRWCRDVTLTPIQIERLVANKSLGQKKGSIIAAVNKKVKRQLLTLQIFDLALQEVGQITKRDRFIAGLALYAGEGDKGEGKSAFTNSNPELIRFMMHWFREFCEVPENKFRGAIWLHEGLDEEKSKSYWSELTDIPVSQFHKTYIAKVKSDTKKIRKNIHQYGVFAIRFSDTYKQRRLLGWISALISGKIPPVL